MSTTAPQPSIWVRAQALVNAGHAATVSEACSLLARRPKRRQRPAQQKTQPIVMRLPYRDD